MKAFINKSLANNKRLKWQVYWAMCSLPQNLLQARIVCVKKAMHKL